MLNRNLMKTLWSRRICLIHLNLLLLDNILCRARVLSCLVSILRWTWSLLNSLWMSELCLYKGSCWRAWVFTFFIHRKHLMWARTKIIHSLMHMLPLIISVSLRFSFCASWIRSFHATACEIRMLTMALISSSSSMLLHLWVSPRCCRSTLVLLR